MKRCKKCGQEIKGKWSLPLCPDCYMEQLVKEWHTETLCELLEHCKTCPHFNITTDGCREFYECTLLEEERIQEFEEEDEEYEPDGSEGLLAVADYDINGNLVNVTILSNYPKSCERR